MTFRLNSLHIPNHQDFEEGMIRGKKVEMGGEENPKRKGRIQVSGIALQGAVLLLQF